MFIDINGARLFFDSVGAKLEPVGDAMVERPSMLVLHGGPGFDHSGLRSYFDRFADTHQVIYLDHRGNGRSGGSPDTWTLAQWGDDIHAFCQALGIDKPVVFGQSFGGMVAMSYAARHPEAPSRLIFSSTAGNMDWDAIYDAFERLGGPEARTLAERFWIAPTPEIVTEYMRVCRPLYNPIGTGARDARDRAIMRTPVMIDFITGEQRTMNLLAGLSVVQCPTLVLAGGLDPVTPPPCARAIHAALPAQWSELVVYDDAGHGIYRDKPDEAEALLRRFLA
jgi:pimeloyl-ACP methyl ester carboxylesterase